MSYDGRGGSICKAVNVSNQTIVRGTYTIQVWDKANLSLIDSAIQKSELGINPQVDGQIIRLRIPDLTEERRKDLIKVLKK